MVSIVKPFCESKMLCQYHIPNSMKNAPILGAFYYFKATVYALKRVSYGIFNYLSKDSSTISASTAFTETLLIPFITPLLDLYPSSLIAMLSPFEAIKR